MTRTSLITSVSKRLYPLPWVAGMLAIWFASAECGLSASDSSEAAGDLAASGLVKKGSVWLAREEVDWEGALARFDADERDLAAAERKVDGLLRQRVLAVRTLPLIQREYDQLRSMLDGGKLPPQQRTLVSAEADKRSAMLAQLRALVGHESDGDPPQLKASLVALADVRTRVVLDVLCLERQAATVSEAYKRLAGDAKITAAIAALGPANRLGPARNLSRDIARVEKLKAQVFTAELPIYRENGSIRLSTVIQERVPATFTLDRKVKETWLPASLAEAAGLHVRDSDRVETVALENGRMIAGRRVKLGTIRIGSQLLSDVDVLVLSPETAHMGAHLGQKALENLRVEVDMERFRMTIAPAAADRAVDSLKRETEAASSSRRQDS